MTDLKTEYLEALKNIAETYAAAQDPDLVNNHYEKQEWEAAMADAMKLNRRLTNAAIADVDFYNWRDRVEKEFLGA